MQSYQQELSLEKDHAKDVVEQVKQYKKVLEQTLSFMGEENLRKLKDLRDNAESNPTDLLMFIEQLHSQNQVFNFKDKIKQLEELTYLLQEPYFSRIDLLNRKDQHTDKVYIGRFGLTTPDSQKPVITDWRAKIASVFYKYRYPQKNVEYETEGGRMVRDLELKRTYEFDGGDLLKYFNNDIQLDENEIISEKISKRTGGVLEDIVATIQESQMEIIEQDPRSVCIVQGCVGSGKSTVAIHKMSHIFFNYPNLIHAHNSLLIAKNQILVGYLSTLFPKLGIFDINYGTLKDLIIRITFAHGVTLNLDLDNEEGLEDTGMDLIDRLRGEINTVREDVINKVTALEENPAYSSYFSFVYDDDMSLQENVSTIIDDLEEEIKYQKERIDEGASDRMEIKHQENIKVIKKLIRELRKISNSLRAGAFPALLRSLNINVKAKINYRDAIIYTFLYAEFFGVDKFKRFEYCVVDEGQDFSLLEYLLLNKLVLRGRFCILGDLNQSYMQTGLNEWESIENVITEAKECKRFDLTTNYRSTKPIIDYACGIITPFSSNYLPGSINRIGPPVIETPYMPGRYDEVQNALKHDIEDLDKSIGIICFNSDDFDKMRDHLESHYKGSLNEKLVILNPKDRIFYTPKGVYLTMFENCKGLEFSKVYVLGINKTPADFHEAKMNYVAVTRAMNELVVYHK